MTLDSSFWTRWGKASRFLRLMAGWPCCSVPSPRGVPVVRLLNAPPYQSHGSFRSPTNSPARSNLQVANGSSMSRPVRFSEEFAPSPSQRAGGLPSPLSIPVGALAFRTNAGRGFLAGNPDVSTASHLKPGTRIRAWIRPLQPRQAAQGPRWTNAGGRRGVALPDGFRWKAILDTVITREVTAAVEGEGQFQITRLGDRTASGRRNAGVDGGLT